MRAFGISPAFVVSRHTTRFSIDDYCASLLAAHDLGFTSYQPEIFHADTVAEWAATGAAKVNATAQSLGLTPSQFVAHFLLDDFASADRLASPADTAQLERALNAALAFPECKVFTVPMAPFRIQSGDTPTPAWHHEQRKRLTEKLHLYHQLIRASGLRFAVEILPFSLMGNTDGFLRLTAELGATDIGINLDTGHAWATRENMELLPFKLQHRIAGTHLKDNNSDNNLPLAPGKGTIPWTAFLNNLVASGYTGALDIEIGCPADQVATEYTAGRTFLLSLPLN